MEPIPHIIHQDGGDRAYAWRITCPLNPDKEEIVAGRIYPTAPSEVLCAFCGDEVGRAS